MKTFALLTSFLLSLFLFIGCRHHPATSDKNPWQEIYGRNEEGKGLIERDKIYRARVPIDWKRIDPLPDESNVDTTLPICEYSIEENGESVVIAIHNFPYDKFKERVPPQAQVARWKKQFNPIDPSSVNVEPFSHGGFSGFIFDGEGVIKGEEKGVIAFAMQLAPEHFRTLQIPLSPQQKKLKQMRGDYTIKAVGPISLIRENREQIIQFSRTFELIEEISPRL